MSLEIAIFNEKNKNKKLKSRSSRNLWLNRLQRVLGKKKRGGGMNNISNTQEWYAQKMTKKRRRMVVEGRRGTKG